jgi:DNA-binding beta-propeller fold protein YncE
MRFNQKFVRFKIIFAMPFLFLFANSATVCAQIKPLPRPVPAPSLSGAGDWLNCSGPLDLKDLRGKFVILDFWTYCCINCMHILPELKKLEKAYPNELVVIGVHSAKFATERESENIRQAVLRHKIEHPVVNDANLVLWRKYFVDVWPSLRVIDPEGNVIAEHRGEITFEELDDYLKRTIGKYRRAGTLDERPVRFDLELYRRPDTPLRFPGKVLADTAGKRLFISDNGHNRIVVAGLDGQLLDVIGTGEAAPRDGGYDEASFDHPQGMALHDGNLYVADTENHLVRRIDLQSQRVTTVAGTGKQARTVPKRARTSPRIQPLASPWDLWAHRDDLFIAMAGTHQIWRMSLRDRVLGPFAGNAIEDIVDGPPLSPAPFQKGFASFAQPSGLASDGRFLYVADAEGSSIRAVPLDGGPVTTVVGTAGLPTRGCSRYGDRDGPAAQALLQHPVGIAYDEQAKAIYVADTYNHKIKRIDLQPQVTVTTVPIAIDPPLHEPSGLSVGDGLLYVADTNNHRIVVWDLQGQTPARTLEIRGLEPPAAVRINPFGPVPGAVDVKLPRTAVRPVDGHLAIDVSLTLPPGHKINAAAPVSYAVQSSRPGIIDDSVIGQPIRIEQPGERFQIRLPLRIAEAVVPLKLHLVLYYCREGAEALCMIENVAWTGEIEVAPTAAAEALRLDHKIR